MIDANFRTVPESDRPAIDANSRLTSSPPAFHSDMLDASRPTHESRLPEFAVESPRMLFGERQGTEQVLTRHTDGKAVIETEGG